MLAAPTLVLALAFGLTSAFPLRHRQARINEEAAAEAHQFDDTATRAFTKSVITTSDGQCFTVDPLGGDFRQNLIPVTIEDCDGSPNQEWDFITAGRHNDRAGFTNIVSSLTNGCVSFDPRRSAGDQVTIFSCGGRADGGGETDTAQLYTFDGNAGPLSFVPSNSNGAVCLTPVNGRLDQTACDAANQDQLFTIGGGQENDNDQEEDQEEDQEDDQEDNNEGECLAVPTITSTITVTVTAEPEEPAATDECPSAPTVTVTVTAAPDNQQPTETPTETPSETVSAPQFTGTGTAVLNLEAVAEAHQRDDTATRAFSDVSVKTSDGKCLQIDALSGDFRQNLIPVTVEDCDDSAGQKWDVITAGKHNNQEGTMLVVSTLTQGCLNFDDRRAAGDQVNIFSCGGRAAGEGETSIGQLFEFSGDAQTALQSETNNNPPKCLIENNGRLDVADCSDNAEQQFTFEA